MLWSNILSSLALTATTARAVTIYTTFTTDANGQPVQPSYTNTATGPAYTGYGGL
ncbi:hypothetical protein DL93DRAFT_2073402 [Clavulina sp. PMI_390]|nr:hypothetical protein DL93DRAFT_2073402 [Clavulina sp. PMI_390]